MATPHSTEEPPPSGRARPARRPPGRVPGSAGAYRRLHRPWIVALAVALAAAGCQPGKPEHAAEAPADIRGEPIVASIATPPAPATGGSSLPLEIRAPTIPADPSEPVEIGFDVLSAYVIDEAAALARTPGAPSQIPETIRALNGRLAAVKGFMLPLKIEQGLVTDLLLMRDQSMCCFGIMPRINDWISVKMRGRGVKAVLDQPVTLLGKLEVGEAIENGLLVSVYRLDGEQLVEALDL